MFEPFHIFVLIPTITFINAIYNRTNSFKDYKKKLAKQE